MFRQLGPWEILIILLVFLLLFGAKRLPEIARNLGKGIKEFKKTMKEADKEDSGKGKESDGAGGEG